MTLDMIRREIKQLLTWMEDYQESGNRGASDAVDKATLGLENLGVIISKAKGVEFQASPTLPGGTHVNREFIVGFRRVRDDFLKTYNASLLKRGLKPVHISV